MEITALVVRVILKSNYPYCKIKFRQKNISIIYKHKSLLSIVTNVLMYYKWINICNEISSANRTERQGFT